MVAPCPMNSRVSAPHMTRQMQRIPYDNLVINPHRQGSRKAAGLPVLKPMQPRATATVIVPEGQVHQYSTQEDNSA